MTILRVATTLRLKRKLMNRTGLLMNAAIVNLLQRKDQHIMCHSIVKILSDQNTISNKMNLLKKLGVNQQLKPKMRRICD